MATSVYYKVNLYMLQTHYEYFIVKGRVRRDKALIKNILLSNASRIGCITL